ncbi:hypothetical protein [Spirillospora sp. NBC_01491]|uniref:hypothetical protein n=1 Tax=Spirillospora sp. NBC_01491 TaxID=2976007 RepID=UPI002E3516C1|nr:hypothetical protein [Spirillospora sp. NBC_01491]
MTVALDLDTGRAAAELRRRFPGVSVWRGSVTGHWWAIARARSGRDCLVEAANPVALGRCLEELGAHGFTPRSQRGVQNGAAMRSIPSPQRSRIAASTKRRPWGGCLRRLFRCLLA